MRIGACNREKEILAHLKSGHAPSSFDPDLRNHIQTCSLCRDTIAIRSALQAARATSTREAPLNSPNILWWRAQIRQRYEAVERVNKPIAGANRFALALNLLVIAASILWLSHHATLWQTWLAQIHPPTLTNPQTGLQTGLQTAPHTQTLAAFTASLQTWNLSLLIPCAAAIALLGGIVVYLATDKS